MLKILITGGAGFLGFHCTKILSDKECEITCLDIAEFDTRGYPKNAKLLEADVRDFKKLCEIVSKGFDVIIHAAAALPLWSEKDIISTNVDGTRNVLEIAQKYSIDRVIFISSTAVYGIPKVHPIYETAKSVGVGCYGESKILAEAICTEYRKKGLCVSIIRPKTFIGPERLGVFQILYDWVECGKKIPIIGNGKNRYQLFEVEDLVEAIWLVATKDKKLINDTFNVGAKEFRTIMEDVGALCSYAKSGASVLRTPASAIKLLLSLFEKMKISPLYKWIYGTADKDSFVSIEKIEKKLGWKPKYSNSEALIRSYQWYLDNKSTIKVGTGITHRVGWSQGILKLFKKLL